jgi:nucleoside-diphosphate-sugar epimerase
VNHPRAQNSGGTRSRTSTVRYGRSGAPSRWAQARAAAGEVVAVTGSDAVVGAAVVAALRAQPGVREVRETAGGQVPTADSLRGAGVLVHLEVSCAAPGAGPAGPGNVAAARSALAAAAEAGVPRLVLCTSAMVYGADETNAVPLDEDAPLRAAPVGGLVAELLAIEELGADRAAAGMDVTVVRPGIVVGDGADTVIVRHFEAPRLLHLQGARPAWQFCHVDDLVAALESAALGRVSGAVTVACEGWLEQEELEAIAGMRRVVLPASLAFGTAERLHRFGVSPAPPSDLRYVAYPWVVPATRLRATGWRPSCDNVTALQVLLADVAERQAAPGRRAGPREGSLGAAGAAVAMVGTAALLRQARRRRHGG